MEPGKGTSWEIYDEAGGKIVGKGKSWWLRVISAGRRIPR